MIWHQEGCIYNDIHHKSKQPKRSDTPSLLLMYEIQPLPFDGLKYGLLYVSFEICQNTLYPISRIPFFQPFLGAYRLKGVKSCKRQIRVSNSPKPTSRRPIANIAALCTNVQFNSHALARWRKISEALPRREKQGSCRKICNKIEPNGKILWREYYPKNLIISVLSSIVK